MRHPIYRQKSNRFKSNYSHYLLLYNSLFFLKLLSQINYNAIYREFLYRNPQYVDILMFKIIK